MYQELKEIRIAEIDLDDSPYSVTAGRPFDTLVASIAAVGLINPPAVSACGGAAGYRVVCGLQRLRAAAALHYASVMVRVLPEGLAERELLVLAIHDNCAQRQLNPVEQAAAVARLGRFFTAEQVRAEWLPLLGLEPTGRSVRVAEALMQLEPEMRLGLLSGTFSERVVEGLAGLAPGDRRALFEVYRCTHLSASKQAEVLEHSRDIARRDGIGVREVLGAAALQELLGAEHHTPSQRGDRVRRYLRLKRYPRLTDREDRFGRLAGSLGLPDGVCLKAPPAFEGDTYRLEVSFRHSAQLREAGTRIAALADSPLMQEMLGECR